jgi:hypothetical protein
MLYNVCILMFLHCYQAMYNLQNWGKHTRLNTFSAINSVTPSIFPSSSDRHYEILTSIANTLKFPQATILSCRSSDRELPRKALRKR